MKDFVLFAVERLGTAELATTTSARTVERECGVKKMRLIDADSLPSDVLLPRGEDEEEFEFVSMRDIELAPTIDAKPVNHAYWEWDEDEESCICTGCQRCLRGMALELLTGDAKYCPYCGARITEKYEVAE